MDDDAFGGGFGGGFGDDFDTGRKSKKEKKSKKRSGFDGFDPVDGYGLTRDEPNTLTFETGEDGSIQAATGDDDLPVLRNIAIYFDGIRALDAGVYQDVGDSIMAMDDELRKVREESCEMEHEVQKRYLEAAEADAERRLVEHTLKDAQARLGTLHTDRRGINVNHLSVGEDRGRIAEEMEYLQKATEQEEETLLMIKRSTGFLKKSFEDIEAHHKLLENQRVRLLEEVKMEKAKLADEIETTRAMRELEEKLRLDRKVDIENRTGGAAFRAADRFLQTPLDRGTPSDLRSGRVIEGV